MGPALRLGTLDSAVPPQVTRTFSPSSHSSAWPRILESAEQSATPDSRIVGARGRAFRSMVSCSEADKPFWAWVTLTTSAILLIPYTCLNLGLFDPNSLVHKETITSFAGLLWFGWTMFAVCAIASIVYLATKPYVKIGENVHDLSLGEDPESGPDK